MPNHSLPQQAMFGEMGVSWNKARRQPDQDVASVQEVINIGLNHDGRCTLDG